MTSDIQKEELWALCFGDSPELAREFFAIDGIRTVCEYSGDTLIGMASMIPLASESALRGDYVYGVCVHPEYRGQGVFRKLMARCEQIALNNGDDFICLIPATDALVRSYSKMGYSISVALCDSASDSTEKLTVSCDGFRRFAATEEDAQSAVRFGLMKPLGNSVTKKMSFSFSERMGEI